MAEGQVGLCVGWGGEGPGGIEAGTGLAHHFLFVRV